MLSFKDFAKQYAGLTKFGKGKADETVRLSLAKNPKKAGKFVQDPSWKVRAAVAKHAEHREKLVYNTSKPKMKAHEIEPDHRVRFVLARHDDVAGALVHDPHPDVRRLANQTQWKTLGKRLNLEHSVLE